MWYNRHCAFPVLKVQLLETVATARETSKGWATSCQATWNVLVNHPGVFTCLDSLLL